ncbi:MAG TPA: hypothetical protein VGM90_27555 [Kofleriaceae bacterium]|jgi:Zn-finger nucleic acid-binding protein
MTELKIGACPACSSKLREFQSRLVCDACEGMMMSLADLSRGIFEMTSLEPALSFDKEVDGKRRCPHCDQAMKRCEVRIDLEGHIEKPHVELDRCETHGLWFDKEELGKVLEKVAGKGYGGGVGRKQVAGDGAPTSDGRSSTFSIGGRGWAS